MIHPVYIGIYIISGVFMLIGMIVGSRMKSRMQKYSQMPTSSGMSGREIAEKMLRDSGIYDVTVTSTQGFLTDHYNPTNKTVNLSEAVYNQRNVTAAAVAAHECGHAVQHARAYGPLQFRSKMVPIVRISGMFSQFVIIAGVFMVQTFPQLLLAGIVLFAATTVFTVVTLPVEFDASKRALAWLQNSGITRGQEYAAAKDGLRWAAMTYVVAALQSVATLIYYIVILMNRR